MTDIRFPNNYTPHKSLFLCGLTVYNYKVLFNISDTIPLLIGNGDKPKIWLQTLINNTPLPCIEDNIILQEPFSISHGKDTLIKAETYTILTISESNFRHATIPQIDFRPIGLNIYGDTNGLTVGGTLFSNLTFKDVEILFALQNK